MAGNTTSLGIKDEIAALKRERTIAAAVELFYEHGYENTTLEAVAEKLGVTKPFINAHFGSKAELLAEICGRGINSSLKAIDNALALRASPTKRLKVLAETFVTSVLENQKHIAIFAREEKNLAKADFARISEMRRTFDKKLLHLLNTGLESGEFEMEDPPLAALAIGGMVSWAYVWYRPKGRMTVAELADKLSDLILATVGVKSD